MDLEKRIAQLSPAKLALLEQKLKKSRPEGGAAKPQTAPATRQKYAPLSFAQERLWFLEQMEPDSCLYNLPAIIALPGPVDPDRVQASVREIVTRHTALRTRFVVREDSPYQVIAEDVSDAIDFATVDLRAGAAAPSSQVILSQTVNDEIWTPFNLATGPLLRARLFLQRNNENFLLVVMHHIVSDGWSISVFTREFRALYESGESALPPVPQQYVDYSISQRESLGGERLAKLISYWRNQLDGAPSVIGLPLDHPRPARQSFQGALYPFRIGAPSLQNLKSLCRECNVVPFMVLLSAFEVLLFRYTNQSRIVVGTPIANRNRSELETVIGFFTNTLILCSSMTPAMTFRELLAQVRETTLGAYEHQELPFEKLVSELQPERSLSHNPLFQVMFTFQNLPGEKPSQAGQPEQALSLDFRFSKFDLTLAMTETGDGLSAVFEYATDLFDPGTIERMAGHFVNVLEHVLQNPDDEVASFPFLSPDERTLILDRWNDTGREWAEVLPLHGRFERCAREAPQREALKFRDISLTYAQLDRRANHVAQLLRRGGVDRGSIVGIWLPRSPEMVIGLYGILKAGAAYMPIEPDFPEERVAYMLNDAKVTHVLTTSDCLPRVSKHDVEAIVLDHIDAAEAESCVSAPPVTLSPADIAYVLFTSGSTGQPKGVMVSHGAIDNRLQWMQEAYGLGPDDRVMQKTPYTFDVSVWEFFWTLSTGACLVVAEPGRHKESLYLVDLIQRERVTCLHFVPSMLQLFLHEDLTDCVSLKRIVCSGEALTVEQCRQLQALPGVSAHNLYGPTEAAVDVTHWDCDQWRDQYLSVPIGRPISNTQIYILNERLQPCPIGIPGELYIGGHNLAAGYLNKPELTARQFVPSPFAEGARLYKTGDLARFRDDGNIEYIGRIDSQIKLRGLRIELGEIESVLRQHPGIIEAAVIVHRFGDHDDRLAAYVVPETADAALDVEAVTTAIAKKLPNYMVPATITVIPELPLSANGKLDRKRLPEPAVVRSADSAEPANDIEKQLLVIWRRFLKTDRLNVNDDFFALGGHSILATQVINSINGQFHLDVPVRLLFESPTVRLLAKALSEFEDEVWLDESRMATALLTRSDRRLLNTLDELTEEQLDEFLKQHLEDPALAEHEDVKSLLAWSRRQLASPRPAAKTQPLPVLQADGQEPAPALAPTFAPEMPWFISAFLKHYYPLAQTRAAIDGLRLLESNGGGERLLRLRDQAREIFESYTREVTLQLSMRPNGHGPMTPQEMAVCCSQLAGMAALAASTTAAATDGRDERADDARAK